MNAPLPSPAAPLDCGALFDAHASFVWRVLKRHGVPERDLPDGCQEVFLVVHRRLGEFAGRSSVRTWLYGIAVRVALGLRRKAHHAREILSDTLPEASHAHTPLLEVERRAQLSLLDDALAALSVPKREAFALYELEGMTMAEAAHALGVPENTALSRLYAARDEVRTFVTRREIVRVPKRAGSTP